MPVKKTRFSEKARERLIARIDKLIKESGYTVKDVAKMLNTNYAAFVSKYLHKERSNPKFTDVVMLAEVLRLSVVDFFALDSIIDTKDNNNRNYVSVHCPKCGNEFSLDMGDLAWERKRREF